jgi:hypothetical protein
LPNPPRPGYPSRTRSRNGTIYIVYSFSKQKPRHATAATAPLLGIAGQVPAWVPYRSIVTDAMDNSLNASIYAALE